MNRLIDVVDAIRDWNCYQKRCDRIPINLIKDKCHCGACYYSENLSKWIIEVSYQVPELHFSTKIDDGFMQSHPMPNIICCPICGSIFEYNYAYWIGRNE